MVYFEPSDLGLAPFTKNWFNYLPSDFPQQGIDCLNELLEFSLLKGLFGLKHLKAQFILLSSFLKALNSLKREKVAQAFHSLDKMWSTQCSPSSLPILTFSSAMVVLERLKFLLAKVCFKESFHEPRYCFLSILKIF